MKFLKKLTIIFILIMTCTLSFTLGGCWQGKGTTHIVNSIEKINSNGQESEYKITFNDGSHITFTVKDGIDGQNGIDGVGISDAEIDEEGNLILTYSDGNVDNLGKVVGENGKDGVDGKDGKDGEDGSDGNDGIDGKDSSLTVQDLYNEYKKLYGEMTYDEFLSAIFGADENNEFAINSCLRSSLKVYAFFKEQDGARCGVGSSVIYKTEETYSYLVTNYHVIYDQNAINSKTVEDGSLYVYAYGAVPQISYNESENTYEVNDGYAISAEYIGGARKYDVAVLRVKTQDLLLKNQYATQAKLNLKYYAGDKVYAIGNALNEGISITSGVVGIESVYAAFEIAQQVDLYRSIKTDVAINHGNSGGGLFNVKGELVALINGGQTVTVDEVTVPINGEGYAIPGVIVKSVADGVIDYYLKNSTNRQTKIYCNMLDYGDANINYVYDQTIGKGELVADVVVVDNEFTTVDGQSVDSENQHGKQMGLLVGDVITHFVINGEEHKITRAYQLYELCLTVRSGDVIKYKYNRGGNNFESLPYTIKDADLYNPDTLEIQL